ncbi:type II toxin-antitoxin system VapC family toxin [Leucothrix pacifica]|uniref:Twitching motility protein PilT n=1 Tax=Leucothrix pacifica TaxID=1247513 RepID=A0A317CPE1_9GAMM|nr:type II toxin-antitoxin system VapC family toxin [Leucothrix pacifica]PWR00295.1 twitching motility protein PilT [Leucothrix pacifica]
MSKVVLDTSAVLAYLFDQTGAEKVAPILESGAAVISSANYAETVSKLFDLKMPSEAIQTTMDNLEMECIALSEQQAFIAGELRLASKAYGLSLGDRACLALGIETGYAIYTAAKAWAKVPVECEIILIR